VAHADAITAELVSAWMLVSSAAQISFAIQEESVGGLAQIAKE